MKCAYGFEPEVAAKACECANEEQKRNIKELCDEVEHLYLSGKNHIPKDMEFHASIAKCSGNGVVEVLVPVIHTAVTTFANLTNRKLNAGNYRYAQGNNKCDSAW